MRPRFIPAFSLPSSGKLRPDAAAFLVLAALLAGPAHAQQVSTSSTKLSEEKGLTTTQTTLDKSSKFSFHESRVIVRFRQGTSFLPGSGNVLELSRERNTHLVNNPPGLSVQQVLARYKNNPNVVYAEPDYNVRTIGTPPDDPLYATSQWDLPLISAPQAWDLQTNASGVVVAIVDTGIDFTHPDLTPNLYSDSANPTIRGYTCMNGSCVAGGQDDHGHGTHVAGTIGAATNNATGIAGLNWNVKLLAIKFLSSSGSGSTSDALLGFNLLQSMKSAGVNIRVTNNSWGGGGYSQALKDAMAALEQPTGAILGTLNVCAAGNSGVNSDFTPMYPGAYDNRGIVSVVATDKSDIGASFTNYGLASTDIAAPGVSTLSTVPTGTCSLCDSSGYKFLSGTSMAAPHVSGVAAGLLARNPTLSAFLARDALLQPSSYDALTDAKARSTSSGGRLNFAKTLQTSLTSGSALNQFPVITTGPDVYTTGGNQVNFSQTALDLDDATANLRFLNGKGPISSWTAWLFGWRANQLFPSTLPFTAPNLARTAAMPYGAAVADNRGGSDAKYNWAVVSPVAAPGRAPTGVLTVPATASVGSTVSIGFVGTDPEGGPVAWDLNVSGPGGSSGSCCFTGSSTSRTFNTAGVYRVTVQAIDSELNTSPTYSSVISIGGGAGVPPIADVKVSARSGAVPFSVTVDGSGSTDPDGAINTYFFDCGAGYAVGQSTNQGSCSFDRPGTYWVRVLVKDTTGLMGVASEYVVAYPQSTTLPTLTVGKSGAGTGTVTSNPGGIDCGATCTSSFTSGASVTSTATAAPGSTFAGWSGACSGLLCTISMNGSTSVTAAFNPATVNYTLSVTKSGPGTVTSDKSGINCGTACSASYAGGSDVTLTATAQKGKRISSWGGACAGVSAATTSCKVTMNANKGVSVTFK